MNPKVDKYLEDGCGRCSDYQTPNCKVHTWHNELVELRRIANESGLEEDLKWSQPCYTWQNKNIVLVTAFREYAAMAFFQGSLLKDPKKILVAPGENSNYVKQARYTKVEDIIKQEDDLKSFIIEAVTLSEKKNVVEKIKQELDYPAELIEIFQNDPALEEAFHSLTPGRQRGYLIYFTQPKQSKTKTSRILQYRPQILKGEGMHDAYRKSKNN